MVEIDLHRLTVSIGQEHAILLLHIRSGETVGNWVGNQLATSWLLVATHISNQWGYFQLPTQKATKPVGYYLYKQWAGDWARFR